MRGKDRVSEIWVPERGLREGRPSSPGLFNIFYQVMMKAVEKKRRIRAGRNAWKWGSTTNGFLEVCSRHSKQKKETISCSHKRQKISLRRRHDCCRKRKGSQGRGGKDKGGYGYV